MTAQLGPPQPPSPLFSCPDLGLPRFPPASPPRPAVLQPPGRNAPGAAKPGASRGPTGKGAGSRRQAGTAQRHIAAPPGHSSGIAPRQRSRAQRFLRAGSPPQARPPAQPLPAAVPPAQGGAELPGQRPAPGPAAAVAPQSQPATSPTSRC